jgi:hypothetical protein
VPSVHLTFCSALKLEACVSNFVMADQNSYIRYKRDTRHLIYWMIHASNSIIESSSPLPIPDAVPTTVNTTGEITVSTLVLISKLIAKHINPIPSTIYRLFQSVIAARTATHTLFQQIVAEKPDPETERSNVSHKRFIDALTEAFEALGGEAWASKQKSEAETPDEEDVDEVIFANKFSALGLDAPKDGEEAEDTVGGGSDEPSIGTSPVRPKKNSTRKVKKGKRGKRAKRKPKPSVKEPSLDEVPLESYRIIDDESGIITDYLMAVFSLVKQWIELRSYVQGLWREVSYCALHSAVAGALSNMAIAMIKQTESAIFVDFPGHESYETVMKTITRGDPDKAKGTFHMTLYQMQPGAKVAEAVQQTDVDIKEQFLIHAYWDLLAFISDFQKTRSGKPTKPILSEIRDWDPKFDLQRASKEQRIKWRRAYTINWLYDLVNVFSSIVVQRNTMKGQNIVLETVDWSINGPWNEHRRLFGLNEFAGDITSLAMQKPGTDIRQKILPHHVFQLQCIVDSLTVSRGWLLSSLRGHLLSPPAQGFRPRRDLDLFMDRKNERMGHGYCQAVDTLTQLFQKDAMMHGDLSRNQQQLDLLRELRDDFVNWLGESKYMYGLKTIPPSRFSNTNSNGLWEYSPFLCGVGLIEALVLAYGINFMIWDRMPEPICIIHLHNMLVQRGYIRQEVGLYSSLQQLFPTAFFANGRAPTSDFMGAFLAVVNETGSRRATFQRRAISRNAARTAVDLHRLLNLNVNRFFKHKSLLKLYHEVDWVPERIPDEEVPALSALGMIRIHQTDIVTDPATGKRALKSTAIVSRARSDGIDDETMIQISMLQNHSIDETLSEAVLASLPKGCKNLPLPKNKSGGSAPGEGLSGSSELLSFLKFDIINDVSGERQPLSSLNYVWVTVRFMMLFRQIEEELKRLRSPLWVLAYEREPSMMREKRLSLTTLVLAEEDDECMKVIAREFQNPRTGFTQHIYWEDLDDDEKILRTDPANHDEAEVSCTVM